MNALATPTIFASAYTKIEGALRSPRISPPLGFYENRRYFNLIPANFRGKPYAALSSERASDLESAAQNFIYLLLRFFAILSSSPPTSL